MSDYETVHTIAGWHDGARGGIADFKGKPHYYENHWNDDKDDWSEFYFLQPLDAENFCSGNGRLGDLVALGARFLLR